VNVVLSSKRVSGANAVSAVHRRFFSERCYLPQSTLSRLLEIYQDSDAQRSDTPLTAFVKDLLGLDRLEALIDGLHDAGDIRRLRAGVPAYGQVRERLASLEKEVEKAREEKQALDRIVARLERELTARVERLLVPPAPASSALAHIESRLREEDEGSSLLELARMRRDLRVLSDQWASAQVKLESGERTAIEIAYANARRLLDEWRAAVGQSLSALFRRLSTFFADLPSPEGTSPEHAHSSAERVLIQELQRCRSIVMLHETASERAEQLAQSISRATARREALDVQINQHAIDAGAIATLLSALVPHIQGSICPVCDRDYREVSAEPLGAELLRRVARLTESAGKLEALLRERSEILSQSQQSERERTALSDKLLSPTDLLNLKSRYAYLEEFEVQLGELREGAIRGAKLFSGLSDAERALADLRSRDEHSKTLRSAAIDLVARITGSEVDATESLTSMLERATSFVERREVELAESQAARQAALVDLAALVRRDPIREAGELALGALQNDLARVRSAKENADQRIAHVREIAGGAREARTSIVRRVFNESLNAVWHELFVRLAPEEPFVPSFRLPSTSVGPVEAALETVYRSGGRGGNPRAMLSAGNLNTAALTLFLALHLSVRPALPWLLVDDPVQSMDDVHVAQFAALLRTLTKRHGRQVLLAVHERPLFEYLALELSPAFPQDRLITIELGRSSNGATIANYQPVTWVPDPAFAA